VLHSPLCGGQHLKVLKYLVSRGTPIDSGDIIGLTALHHATMKLETPGEIIRALLELGASPNHQNRYGEVPLLGAFQVNQINAIDLLMEFGADLEIPDADGITPSGFFLRTGPQVTAVVRKWIRKRNGEEAPREEKKCDGCQVKGDNIKLSLCSKCRVARYCSPECRRK
jgi:hypothetical protein